MLCNLAVCMLDLIRLDCASDMGLAVAIRLKTIAPIAIGSADGAQARSGHQLTKSTGSHTILAEQVCSTRVAIVVFLSANSCAATLLWTHGDQSKMRDALADPSTSASATLDHQSDVFVKPMTGQRPQSLIRCDQAIRSVYSPCLCAFNVTSEQQR